MQRTQFGTQTSGGASVFFASPEAIDPRDGQAQVARINPGQTIEGRDIKTALGNLGNPDAAKPFYGAVSVTDPSTGATSLETNAGPGYMTRYNSTGETDPIAIERKLRNQEQQFAFNKAKTAAKKNPRAIVRPVEQQPVDESALRGKVVKAALATEREKRDNAKRADQASAIIANLPPNARRTRIR